jgi:hypothetical protein
VKQTEIRRELMAAQKSEAYSRLAERAIDPVAAKARRILDLASE